MKKLIWLLCTVLLLSLASGSFALEPILIGNFELPIDGDDDGDDDRYEDWMSDFEDTAVTSPAVAVTLGTKALKLVDAEGGWDVKISMPFGEYGQTLETNARANAMVQENSALSIDVTIFPGEVVEPVTLALHGEGGGLTWGLQTTEQSVIVDGQPHTYVIVIPQNVKDEFPDGINSFYYNLGFGFQTGSGSATIYVDNIWIYPDGYSPYGPYDRSQEQVFNADPTKADVTFHWMAGKDPNEDSSGYAVNPAIVDQYFFMNKGGAAAEADPNLYYVGATGVDPGTSDPASQYGPLTLPSDTRYSWVVVEAIDGYEQTFSVGVSTLDDVDPNNIIGPNWSFWTLSNLPIIVTQPASKRFGVNDASVQLTIGVTSATPESYQWYYSTDNKIGGDSTILPSAGGNTNTITFTSHNKAYQAYYYCEISNTATGANPVRSKMASLVVERKVAEYLFDGNLNDTSGMAFNGTGVGTPTYVTGVDGVASHALSLDGTSQYVQIGNAGDPNTFNKAFPRADLFTNVTDGIGTETGAGGGLDVGTVMCWVKLNATDVNELSPILANSNTGWPTTSFYFGMDTDSAAANTNMRTFNFINVNVDNSSTAFWASTKPQWANPYNMGGDGQWHMLAATWNLYAGGTFKQYLDGNLIAQGSSVKTPVFAAWGNLMEIGFDGTNYFGGVIDNLRVYNYELTAEAIENEAYLITGNHGCLYDFDGSNHNSNQLGSSYCRIDLADFAELAGAWLNEGFYPL